MTACYPIGSYWGVSPLSGFAELMVTAGIAQFDPSYHELLALLTYERSAVAVDQFLIEHAARFPDSTVSTLAEIGLLAYGPAGTEGDFLASYRLQAFCKPEPGPGAGTVVLRQLRIPERSFPPVQPAPLDSIAVPAQSYDVFVTAADSTIGKALANHWAEPDDIFIPLGLALSAGLFALQEVA